MLGLSGMEPKDPQSVGAAELALAPHAVPVGPGIAVLGFFIAFFVAQIIGGVAVAAAVGILLVTGSVPSPALDDPQGLMALLTHPLPLLTAAVASSVAFLGTAWVTCIVARRPPRATLGLVRAPVVTCVAAVVGVAALGLLVDEVVHVFRDLLPGLSFGALEGFDAAARAGGIATRMGAIIAMTLVPGTCEEVFFRGFYQRSLVARLGPVLGILVASLTFGLVHLDPPQAIGALLTGAYLGWVAHRAQSIVPAIAAHVANNALAYVGSNVPALAQFGSSGQHYPLLLLLPAAIAACAAILVIQLRSGAPTKN